MRHATHFLSDAGQGFACAMRFLWALRYWIALAALSLLLWGTISQASAAPQTLSKSDARTYAEAAAADVETNRSAGSVELISTEVGRCTRQSARSVVCKLSALFLERKSDQTFTCSVDVQVRRTGHSVEISERGEATCRVPS